MNTSSGTDENVDMFYQVVPCLLLIVGTFGNVLSLTVLCRRSMRESRLTRYLICLSVVDLLVLYTGLLPLCIKNIGGLDIRNSSPFLCKVLPWMLYFSLDMSAWILVSATLERSISVWIPHRVKLICTKKIAIINLVSICVFLLLFNGHFLFGFNLISNENNIIECSTHNNSDYEFFQEKIFSWLDFLAFCIGPFICQFVGNTAIIVGLYKHSNTMARYSMDRVGQAGTNTRVISSMTMMLLFLNIMFLMFTLPISIHFLREAIWKFKDKVFFNATNLLVYVNNCTNFIAYIISGRRFRSELWSMISGRRLERSSTMMLSNISNSQNLGYSAKVSQSIASSINSVYSVSGHTS